MNPLFKKMLCFSFAIISSVTCHQLVAQDVHEKNDLRVMSFNIRYGSASDGDNHWDQRHKHVIATIQQFSPDLLGTQEVLGFQADYLQQNLSDYHYVGRSRENKPAGEQCGILVRKQHFDVLESGHFWLSETPNVPGSKSWDSSLPRMASWVKIFDRRNESTLYFVNTHFDHRGENARRESAKVILARVSKFEQGIPVILVGDFNTAPDSAPHKLLTQEMSDTFDSLHPDEKIQGTFNGFRSQKDGKRIDFVFASPSWTIVAAEIDRTEFDGKNSSDHYPVTSILRFAKEEP